MEKHVNAVSMFLHWYLQLQKATHKNSLMHNTGSSSKQDLGIKLTIDGSEREPSSFLGEFLFSFEF